MAIADKIVIQNNEIKFTVNLETMTSVAAKQAVESLEEIKEIQIDVTEKSEQVTTDKGLTEGYKNTAVSAAGLATSQAGIATAGAGIATEKATQVTNDAAQVSEDKGIVAQDKQDASDFADKAEAWAEGTEPGGVGTKSAKTWAVEAETSRNEVFGLINPTGGVEGDLYRQNALGVLVPISPVELLKSTGPFLKSPLAGMVDLDNVFAWDGFNRPNLSSLGNADSGQSWINLVGDGYRIIDNKARALNDLNISVIERVGLPTSRDVNNQGDVMVSACVHAGQNENQSCEIIIAKDANNYFSLRFATNIVSLYETISGFTSMLISANLISLYSADFCDSIEAKKMNIELYYYIQGSGGDSFLHGLVKELPKVNSLFANVTSRNTVFLVPSDVRYVGIHSLLDTTSVFYNFSARNLNRGSL